jgi:membrane dipeptidase
MLKALAKNNGVIQVCLMSEYLKKMPKNPERVKAYEDLRAKYNGFKDLSEEEMKKARKEWYAVDKKYPQNLASVSDLVDHIDHIVDVAGVDHVGIGSDFDGGGKLKDCYDVSEMGNITMELVKRGYTKKEIEKIWSGNFLRVMRQVEELAEGV